MITLTEANRHTTNKVVKGVIEEIVRDEVVLKKVGFEETDGIAHQYVRESSLGADVSFIDPNEEIPESTADTTQITVALKIMATHADVDNFLASTRGNYYDFVAENIKMRSKKMRHTFMDKFYYGNTTTNTKEFNGLHALMPTAQKKHNGSSSTGAGLSFNKLDEAIDLIRGGEVDCAHMHRTIRRRMNQYVRLNGTLITDRDEFGKMVMFYNNIPIYVDDNLLMTESISSDDYSAATGGATGSIFLVRYNDKGVFGIQHKSGMRVRKITDRLESKDSARYRMLWWVALGLYQTLSISRVDGITDAAATA